MDSDYRLAIVSKRWDWYLVIKDENSISASVKQNKKVLSGEEDGDCFPYIRRLNLS